MGFKSAEDIYAWEVGVALAEEVYRLTRASSTAMSDWKYRAQLWDAVSGIAPNVAEGFGRNNPGDFCRFLDYAIASLDEASTRLKDGVTREHFGSADCVEAFRLCKHCRKVMKELRASQEKFRRKPPPKKRPASEDT